MDLHSTLNQYMRELHEAKDESKGSFGDKVKKVAKDFVVDPMKNAYHTGNVDKSMSMIGNKVANIKEPKDPKEHSGFRKWLKQNPHMVGAGARIPLALAAGVGALALRKKVKK